MISQKSHKYITCVEEGRFMVVWVLQKCITYIRMYVVSMCVAECVVCCEVCVWGGVRCGVRCTYLTPQHTD